MSKSNQEWKQTNKLLRRIAKAQFDYVPIETSLLIIRKYWMGDLLHAPIPTLYKIISEHQRAYLAIKEGKEYAIPIQKKGGK